MLMKLIIVRHYKTKSNAQELIMGWGDAPPEDGFAEDLYFVGRKLIKSKYKFDIVWSSELERAKQTAKFFSELNEISTHIKSDQLNEIDYGLLTNKRKKWAEKHFPKYKKDADFVYPRGESFRQMQKRSVSFIDKQISENPGKCGLVVVHAGVIRGLICHYLNLPYSENLRRRIGHRYIGVLNFDKKGVVEYDEIGESSDFVNDKIFTIPALNRSASQ